MQRIVARYAAKARIDNNISPHPLRHTFATDLYRETSKIRLVQKVLGHSDLSTAMIYTHVFDPEAEDALKWFRQAAGVAVKDAVRVQHDSAYHQPKTWTFSIAAT